MTRPGKNRQEKTRQNKTRIDKRLDKTGEGAGGEGEREIDTKAKSSSQEKKGQMIRGRRTGTFCSTTMALKFSFSNLYLLESTVSCDITSGESVRTLLFELVVTSHDPVPPASGNTPWRNCPSPSTAHQESWRFLLQGMPCQRRHYAKKQIISDNPTTTTIFLIHNSPDFFKLISRAFYKKHKDSSINGANGSNR